MFNLWFFFLLILKRDINLFFCLILKEPLPTNPHSAFKGYHLPFIGYTYTEDSLLNELLMSNYGVVTTDAAASGSTTLISTTTTTTTTMLTSVNGSSNELPNHENEILKLKKENIDLISKLKSIIMAYFYRLYCLNFNIFSL